MQSSIIEHYLKRFKLVYAICFKLNCVGSDYKKWITYYNYYQDMILYHGVSTEDTVIGLSNNNFTKPL